MNTWADHWAAAWVLAGAAFAFAAYSARPYASSYNDGSRLATAESLIERGTLAIDDSLFVHPPPEYAARGIPPYTPGVVHINNTATYDMVRIDGRFYSDKPMVPSVLFAGAYRALMLVGFPRPVDRPDVFCRVGAVLNCGLAYAVAVGCLWVLGRRAGLGAGWRLVWLLGFALATVLPAYTRQVSAGMPQLAAVAGLALLLARAAELGGGGARLFGAGLCAGFGYALDLGSGPPLLALATLAVAVRSRRAAPVAVFLLGALPCVAANHALTYAVGHVWVPLGMVPEYLEWPGSVFNRTNMTGLTRHTASTLAAYAGSMLYGPAGFLVCNLPLGLTVAFGWLALVRRGPDRVEQGALLLWCVAVWAVYAVLSDNFGGACLSVRWFVPLLVPAFWVLARLMADRPTFRLDFTILAGWGLVLGYRMWLLGPWQPAPVRGQAEIVHEAVLVWGIVRCSIFGLWLALTVIRALRKRQ